MRFPPCHTSGCVFLRTAFLMGSLFFLVGFVLDGGPGDTTLGLGCLVRAKRQTSTPMKSYPGGW